MGNKKCRIYAACGVSQTPIDLFECEEIITKVPVYAVERIEAMKRVGFKKSTKLLVGTMDGYAYKDYWTINRGVYIPLDDLEAKEKA